MNLRNYILLYVTSIVFITSSCNQKKNDFRQVLKSDTKEKQYADSIIYSITGKTKTIKINPGKENTITSKKGIQFSIPANAFVTKNGMKPKGSVQVTISEYHNPADILVSKIPMQYNTKNGAVQMESAGMFSITARTKDEVLELASGKDICAQVPSKNSDVDFNLYYFDPLTNTWVKTIDSLSTNQDITDTAVEDKSSSVQPEVEYVGINVEWPEIEGIKRLVDGKTITLVKPDCSYKNKNFDFTVATDNFPELNLYKETVWIGSSNYDEDIVTAAFENDELISATIKGRETPLNRYLMAFEFKHTKFNAHMKIASTSDYCDINDEFYFSYYDSRPVDEAKIEKITNKGKKVKKQAEAFRSFAINSLGLWNCDRLYMLPAKMIVTPRFRSITTGELYASTTTYMIDKKNKFCMDLYKCYNIKSRFGQHCSICK
jgi:hypothetical protein